MPSKNQTKKQKTGFTIIEVVLVLAIAGLIFLMVFVALPALQRSQRDTQRRQDIAEIATAITQYQSNNGGGLPQDGKETDFKNDYLNGGKYDPDGSEYALDVKAFATGLTAPTTFSNHELWIVTSASCDGEKVKQGSARDYAVLYKLEGAGVYCVDNK